MLIGTLLFIAFVVLVIAQIGHVAPVMTECRVCGEPCTIGLCAVCDTHPVHAHWSAPGPHIEPAQLTRALDARTAVRGGDSGLVLVRRSDGRA